MKDWLVQREMVRNAHAHARQLRIAAANARIERSWWAGCGELVAQIDSGLFMRLCATYGTDTVLHDGEFLDGLLRDNPELRVTSRAPRLALRVPGLRDGLPAGGADACTLRAGDEPVPDSTPLPLPAAA